MLILHKCTLYLFFVMWTLLQFSLIARLNNLTTFHLFQMLQLMELQTASISGFTASWVYFASHLNTSALISRGIVYSISQWVWPKMNAKQRDQGDWLIDISVEVDDIHALVDSYSTLGPVITGMGDHLDGPIQMITHHLPWCSTSRGFVSDSWSLYGSDY